MKRVLLTLGCIALASPAWAHGWYDKSCCSDKDCAPVTQMQQDPNKSGLSATATVTTGLGTGTITPSTRWLQSKDDKDHACIMGGRVICFYGIQRY